MEINNISNKVGRKKGCIPWNKGLTKETDERVRKNSEKIHKTMRENDIYKSNGQKQIGKHHTEKTKEKMRKAKIGYVPWNKGKKGLQVSWCKGKICPQISAGLKGRKYTDETKKKMRESHLKYMEKQYNNGLPIMPNIGKYETEILNTLEENSGHIILRQYRVAGYFLDGYIPALRLAIEIDEKYHNKPERLQKDAYREEQIKNEIGCQFLRIPYGGD